MQEYVETAKKTITAATKKVVSKSTKVYETAKLSLKISSLKNDIEENYKKIGKIVYENFIGNDASSEEVEAICNEIRSIKSNISEISEQLAEIKNVSVCQSCGAEVSKDSTFCAKCGDKI